MKITENIIQYGDVPIKTSLCKIKYIAPHFHDTSMEFIYCLRGSVKLHSSFQHPTVNAGEIWSIDCQDIHCIESDEDNLVLLCHADLTASRLPLDYLQHIYFTCETINMFPYQQSAMNWLERVFLTIAKIQNDTASVFTPDYDKLLNELISKLIRYFNFYTYLRSDGYINDSLYERFQNMLIYCHKHYAEKITAKQVAKRENISPNYVSQFMRNTIWESFNEMIKFVRCYNTEKLLLTSDISIREASYRCGFSDPKYFFSAFKKRWGITPKQQRDKYKVYSERPDDYMELTREEAANKIEHYMTEWLIKKTLFEL